MDAKSFGTNLFNVQKQIAEIFETLQALAERLQDGVYAENSSAPRAVVVDENQQARVSELFYRIPEGPLKNIYRDPNAQHISVNKWRKENKNREHAWINRIYVACLIYSILHVLAIVFQHEQLFNPDTPEALRLFRSFSYLGHAVIILIAFIFVIMHKEPALLAIENSTLSSIFLTPEKCSIKRALERATLAVKQCLQYWPWLWVMWFSLYILLSAFFFIAYKASVPQSSLWYFSILFNLLNNGTALVFFITLNDNYKWT